MVSCVHVILMILSIRFAFSFSPPPPALVVKFVWLLVYVDGQRRPLLLSRVFRWLLEVCCLTGSAIHK